MVRPAIARTQREDRVGNGSAQGNAVVLARPVGHGGQGVGQAGVEGRRPLGVEVHERPVCGGRRGGRR